LPCINGTRNTVQSIFSPRATVSSAMPLISRYVSPPMTLI
jgi:uncharacterized protein (DUF433 family)